MALLCKTHLRLSHLSTGQIFRREMARDTALGGRVRRYVTSGRLVPDALVVKVMTTHLRTAARARGYVLDGFPRTRGQAQRLDRVLKRWKQPLDGAIYLTSPTALLVKRLSGRRVCVSCGANYHIRTMRPRRAGRCDRCDGKLIIRKDDQLQTIKKRLSVDHRAAAPLLRYYRRRGILYKVDGVGHIERVFARTLTLLRRQGWVRDDRVKNRQRD